MANSASKPDPARAYENFLLEWKEVLDYKWIESRKADKDIGLERALKEWTAKHRQAWRAHRGRAD